MSPDSGTGSVAEEAARLIEALQEAARVWQRSGRDEHVDPEGEPVPAACRTCPLCQAIAAFQQVKPETVRHLADVAASLTAALADLVPAQDEDACRGAGQQRETTPDPAHDRRQDTPAPPRRRDDVQHIDITD